MAIQPLDQRLNSILPTAAPAAAPADPTQLEPMPAEQAQMGTEATPTDKPGTPSMSEGIQIAGPVDARSSQTDHPPGHQGRAQPGARRCPYS